MKTVIAIVLVILLPVSGFGAGPPRVFVRVALVSPRQAEWRMHIVAHKDIVKRHPPGGTYIVRLRRGTGSVGARLAPAAEVDSSPTGFPRGASVTGTPSEFTIASGSMVGLNPAFFSLSLFLGSSR